MRIEYFDSKLYDSKRNFNALWDVIILNFYPPAAGVVSFYPSWPNYHLSAKPVMANRSREDESHFASASGAGRRLIIDTKGSMVVPNSHPLSQTKDKKIVSEWNINSVESNHPHSKQSTESLPDTQSASKQQQSDSKDAHQESSSTNISS